MEIKQVKLDAIQLGKRVRLSDPCYGTKVWCSGEVDNVCEGKYIPTVVISNEGMWGNRVSMLQVVHEDFEKTPLSFTEQLPFEVGVDSGMAGIYDAEYYEQYHTEKDVDRDWYEDICDSVNPVDTKDNKCVVSSSGYGDGGYLAFVARNSEGQIIAFVIVFIFDEEEEEEDDFFDDEEIEVEEDTNSELPWDYGKHFE
jgi:hypothetical protein